MPSKGVVFTWKLIQNKLLNMHNLLRHNIVNSASRARCALCLGHVEPAYHFFSCEIAYVISYRIFRWVGRLMSLPHLILGVFLGVFLGVIGFQTR